MMSFRDQLRSVSQDTGHEAFRAAFDITTTDEGTDRLAEMTEKYPLLKGVLEAFREQAARDRSAGADPATLEGVGIGVGMVLGTIALVAESEI